MLKTKRGKNNKLVSGRPSPAWSKAVNTHIARGPGNCSSKGPAALRHYSALPQRSDGGWDGAEPHTQVTAAVTRARCAEGT